MRIHPFALTLSLCALLLSVPATTNSQAPGDKSLPPKAPSQDNSAALAKEGSIIEDIETKSRFENDGTSSIETTVRAKIQSEAAVREDGILQFSYLAGNEVLEIKHVRVLKPDGSIVETPLDTAQDLSSEVARAAPTYTDEHEKHVPVRGLAVGDTLEYRTISKTHTPFAPGQFWYSQYFSKQIITLHQSLEFNVPKSRNVKIASPGFTPVISEQGERRIYKFETSHLKKDPEKNKWQGVLDGTPRPDVMLTSFRNWDEVATWYDSLQRSKLEPTPEIRAKAGELTRGMTTDAEKIQAIYDYVSLRFRYIAIMLGQGRYMPHAASEVLTNGFGDCKDKHTLLAALLKAAKIDAYPVLIHSSVKLDPDVPMPAAFDHVITVVPQENSYLWLDTTPGAAPLGMIQYGLRNKLALVVQSDGKGKLITTPANTPFPAYQRFSMTAKLDKDGTLNGNARLEVRGDLELLLREAFRNLAPAQWKDLMQNISNSLGFGGTVDDVNVAPVEDTHLPLWVTYTYHRTEYGDWENRRITLPFPFFGLPAVTKEDEEKGMTALPLGPSQDIDYEAHVTLPDGMYPQMPAHSEKKNDFVEYESRYALKGSVFEGHRHLHISAERIPADKISSYQDLYKIIDADQTHWIPLISSTTASGPHSSNPEAQKLLDEGSQSLQMGAPHAAVESIQSALKLDPNLSDAWVLLGRAQIMNRRTEEGLSSFRKAISIDPGNVRAYWGLANTLQFYHRDAEVIEALRGILKVEPDNRDASSRLANLLVLSGKENEARALLEKLVADRPNGNLCIQLAQIYLNLKESQKAETQLRKAIDLSSDAPTLNNAAYIMAEANIDMPLALKSSQQAVQQIEAATSANSTPRYDLMTEVAAEWDTLGWIYFKMNDLTNAERYLSAAWKLWQVEAVGDHLGQLYEKQGQEKRALQMYALTLATIPRDNNSPLREKLTSKLKANSGRVPGWSESIDELQKLRTFHMKPLASGERSADFMVAITKGPKVEDVQFLNGAQELNGAGTTIAALKFQAEFPDDGQTRIVYHGLLNCSTSRGDCMFVLSPPDPPRPLAPSTN